MSAHISYFSTVLNLFTLFLHQNGGNDFVVNRGKILLTEFFAATKTTADWTSEVFAQFLKTQSHSQNYDHATVSAIQNWLENYPPQQSTVALHHYLLTLKADGCSNSTIRNYRSDIGQFLQFASRSQLQEAFQKSTVVDFLLYQREKGLKSSSARRKMISLTQFSLWAEQNDYLLEPIDWIVQLAKDLERSDWQSQADYKKIVPPKSTNYRYWSMPLSGIDQFASTNTSSNHTPLLRPPQGKSVAKIKGQEVRLQLKNSARLLKSRFTLPSNTPIKALQNWMPYINTLMIFIFLIGGGLLAYRQFGSDADTSLAYPTALTRPNRTLSFQGRLTDTAKNPINVATDMRFRLYDSGPSTTGGTLLWDSDSCSITPDQDGIFSTGLGDECGDEITNEVFSENSNVWLQVEVDNGVTWEVLDPRQSIKTVPYALNSETLQGYPASPSAVENTVLVMDDNGDVVLGSSSPTLQSTGDSFTIEAQALTLQTASGSDGDIIISPDGLGEVIINSDLNLNGFLSAPGATLSANYVGGKPLVVQGLASHTANLTEWSDGDGNITVIDENGNMGIGTSNPIAALHVVGNITSPGSGTNSEKFGYNASAAGIGALAIGNSAATGGNDSAIAIGYNANASAQSAIAIGTSSSATGIRAFSLGYGASNTGNDSVLIGPSSSATHDSVIIGGGTSGASSATVIGRSATVTGAAGIAIGRASSAGAAQLVAGSSSYPISNLFFGKGVTNATPTSFAINGTGGLGTNIVGGDIQIASGKGTGDANSGNISFFTSTPGSSGTTLQTLSEKVRITYDGNVGIGDTSPSYKLDVDGTGRFTGAVDLDGDLELNSTLTDVNGSVGTSGQILSSTATGVDWIDAATFSDTDDQTLAEVLAEGNSAGSYAIDMNTQLITNIGNAGTDFTSGGGLTLAGDLDANGLFTLGDNGETGAIDTSGWDITTGGEIIAATNETINGIDINAGAVSDITTLALSGQLTSSLSTGTAPFSIASTTLVSNLNVDMLDGLDASQFLRSDTSDDFTSGTLGLNSGTTLDIKSGSTLDVNGNLAIADTDIALDGASANLNSTGDFSINTDDIFVEKATGNIGVGTTTPGSLFAVGSTSQFSVNSSGRITSIEGGTVSPYTRVVYVDTGGKGDYTTLNDAIAAVSPTSADPVLIKVGPGTFTETGTITLKSYLTVEGAGVNQTIITGTTSSFFVSANATTLVKNLKLTPITGGAVQSFNITGGRFENVSFSSSSESWSNNTYTATFISCEFDEQMNLSSGTYYDSIINTSVVGGGTFYNSRFTSSTSISNPNPIIYGSSITKLSASYGTLKIYNSRITTMTGPASNSGYVNCYGCQVDTLDMGVSGWTGGVRLYNSNVDSVIGTGTVSGSIYTYNNSTLGTMTADSKPLVITSSAYSLLHIETPSTTQVPLSIKGAPSQTANIFQVNSSASSAGDFFVIDAAGNAGIGTTGPDAKLDSLATSGEQLRLTYTDGSVYTGFTVSSGGDLTINATGGQVLLADADTLNIGGVTGLAYNAISDSGTTSHSLASDDDLYIEGDTEVDGTLWADGALTVAGLATFSNRLDLAAHANNVGLNLPTNAGAPSGVTGTAEGDIVYDTTGNALYVYDGGSFTQIGGGAYSGWSVDDGTTTEAIASGNTLNIADSSTINGVVSATDTLTYNVVADSLNFTELSDSLSLDAATTVALGANAFNLNLDSTGDFVIQDNGAPFATFTDSGSFQLDNVQLDGNTISSITSGGLNLTPLAGEDLSVSLSTTGDFIVNTDDLFVDTSSGFIGIGDATPTYNLDVNGTGRFTGAVDLDADLELNGTLTDINNSVGSSGEVLSSTATGTDWIAPSTLSVGNSDTLDSLDSLQFLRSDTSDDFTSGTLGMNSGTTLDVKSGATLDVNGNLAIADTDIALDGASANLNSTGDFSINTDDIFVEKSTGDVGIGTAAPAARLEVLGDSSTTIAVDGNAIISGSNNIDITGGDFSANHSSSANNSNVYGLTGGAYLNSTGATTNAAGGNFVLQLGSSSAGSQTGAGIKVGAVNYGTTTRVDGALIGLGNNTGTLSNANGLRIENLINLGTITSTYALFVGDITAGTQTNTPYSIYTSDSGSFNYFAGNVGIGDTTPTYKLDVNGTGRFTGAVDLDGDLELNGTLTDVNNSVGSSGELLSSTATGTDWIAPSTLSVGNSDTLDSLDSLQFLRSDTTDDFTSGTLGMNSGTTLDIKSGATLDVNGDMLIADTSIAFDGASTAFVTTGAFTLTPGGAVLLGDGGDTLQINSSDWDISTTGDLTGIGNITMDGRLDTAAHANNVGLNLPTNAGAPSGVTGTAEGDVVWDSTGDGLYVYNGSAFTQIGGGGSYTGWNLAGDTGTPEAIASGNTANIIGGTNGIDTVVSATDTLTLNLDTTEIGTTSFGSGSGLTWTFDASGGTDTTLAFADGTITPTLSAAGLFNIMTGNLKVGNGTPDLALGGEDAYIEGTLEVDSNSTFAGQIASTLATGTSPLSVASTTLVSNLNVDSLDSLDSLQFLRSDTSDDFTSGTLGLNSGTTLDIKSGATLDVNGNLAIADTDIALDGATANLNSTGDFSINTDDIFVEKSTGDVGIGTATPSEALEVTGNILISDDNDYLQLGDFSSNNRVFGEGNNAYLRGNSRVRLQISSTTQLEITSPAVTIPNYDLIVEDGSVGIGTSSPSTLLQLGDSGVLAGTLSIAGSTSGLVTLQTAAAAGTYTLTLPTNDGDTGQVLSTNGSGVTSWITPSAGTIADDSLDFDKFEDTMDLDANLTLNQGSNTWSQSFTGTTTTGLSYAANSLTTGTALSMSSSSLTTGSLVNLASTSTAAGSNTQKLLNLSTSGANGTSTQTTYGLYSANTHTGTTSTNVAGYFTASGGTTNYALQVGAGNIEIPLGTRIGAFTGGTPEEFQGTYTGSNDYRIYPRGYVSDDHAEDNYLKVFSSGQLVLAGFDGTTETIGVGLTLQGNNVNTSLNLSTQIAITANVSNFASTIKNNSTNSAANGLSIELESSGTGTGGNQFMRFINNSAAEIGRIRYGADTSSVAYATTGSGDFAEWIVGTEPTEPGDVIAFQGNSIGKADKGESLAGVHTTYGTFIAGEQHANNPNATLLAVSGVTKMKVNTSSGNISAGDLLTISNTKAVGMKATKSGQTVAKAMQSYSNSNPNAVGMIDVLINLSNFDDETQPEYILALNEIGEVDLQTTTQNYQVTAKGKLLNNLLVAAQVVAARIKTGAIETKDLIANTAQIDNLSLNNLQISGQSIRDYIASVVQEIQQDDELINPVVTIDQDEQIQDSQPATSHLAALIVDGPATISGNLDVETLNAASISAQKLQTENLDATSSRIASLEANMAELAHLKSQTAEFLQATVSGTLYANDIYDFENKIANSFEQPGLIDILKQKLDSGSDGSSSPNNPGSDVYDSLNSSNYNATSSADLKLEISDLDLSADDVTLTAQALFLENYFRVNGAAYVAGSLGVGQQIFVGQGTTIADGSIGYKAPAGQDQIFEVQPSGLGKISLLAGLMTLSDTGLVEINGDLKVAGSLTVKDTLLSNLIQPADFGNPFQVQVAGVSDSDQTVRESRFEIINEIGTPVATISAQGRAAFADGIDIGSETLDNDDENSSVTTDKPSGKAEVAAGQSEITIRTSRITDKTLIYITPVGSTQNQVIYVKSQRAQGSGDNEGKFVVGFDQPVEDAVSFNWWLVN
jgi:glycine cleavage system H lipoate-binding protein